MIADNDKPLFSVIIACYNYGRFLARAIDSVLAQTYTNYEIVVVDDGSTDETPQIAARYTDKIIYHRQQNAGHCATNNKGASLARGAYFYFLDADDELLPDALDAFAAAIARDAVTPVWFGGYIAVSPEGHETVQRGGDIPAPPFDRLHHFITKGAIGLKHGSTVLKRDIFSTLQYPAGLKSNTDIVFFGQVIAHYAAKGIHAPVVKSHAHAGRVRKNAALKEETGLAGVDILFNPQIIPPELMPLKRLFRRQRLLSLARADYRARNFSGARARYLAAAREFPSCLLRLDVLRRLILSTLRSGVNAQEQRR